MDRIQTRKSPFFALLSVTVIAALATLVAGCNSGTEEPEAPEPRALDTGSATGDSGAAAAVPTDAIDPSRFPELPEGAELAVPRNYPKDLPIYPGAAPAQGRTANLGGQDMSAVQLLTNDSPDKTYDYYRGELESKGWAMDGGDSGGERGSAITVTKDGCTASFLFTPSSDGGTDIFSITECGGES